MLPGWLGATSTKRMFGGWGNGLGADAGGDNRQPRHVTVTPVLATSRASVEPFVNIALRAGRRAGKVILRAMDRVDKLRVEEKSRNDFVSEVDRRAEDVIVDTILRAYPAHGVLGEERGVQGAQGAQEEGEFTWIIDPLDGTTNFLHGIPHFCTAIGVRRGPTLLHGVVIDHLRGEEFVASRGGGAFVNGRRMRVAGRQDVQDAIVAGGLPFAATTEHLEAYAAILKTFMARCRAVRRQGSAALDLAYVAAGRVDGFFEAGLKVWDMAAGTVLVREAGGFVGDAAGGDRFLETGNVVAANPQLFRALMRVIRTGAAGDAVLAAG